MVKGLPKFKEYFEAYPGNYIVVGGTACDMVISGSGLKARQTKDIDIILVVEALSADFVKRFWEFIHDGNYERKEKGGEQRKYYRFTNPENPEFPYQIELFSRNPDLLDLDENAHLTPIPTDDELSSLSAILLNDDYYYYILENSLMEDGILRAQTEALICLKAKAWLDISKRLAEGSNEDSKKLTKHKGDVFRLAVIITESDSFDLPKSIKSDLQAFADAIAGDLPSNAIFKEMGLSNMETQKVLKHLKSSFKLN